MTAEQMGRLVANLKRDRTLTSTVLVYRLDPDSEEVTAISGNHRTQAAQQAELPEVDVIEIVSRLSPERLRAIQLSHNSITGQDDLNILAALYDDLPLEEKLYSGLTDDDFQNLQPLDLSGLSVGQPEYQVVELMFFPAEAETFQSLIRSMKLNERVKQSFWIAHIEDFDRVFDAVVGTKEAKNIHNTALAFRAMAELALERLEQLAAAPPAEATNVSEAAADGQAED
ncbi:MAG: hypothetical protein DCF32_10665 [Leptolyngbya sp.]|nr:MAG: hypothetical protein DCF32_10665 [Leptolyngbya sp.]